MSLCDRLSRYLKNSIDCNTILLSGGLDSSILAILGIGKIKYGITIVYDDAPDLIYASKIADMCGLEHIVKRINDEEALDYAKAIVKIMHTFDPIEIRNSIVIYASMLVAKPYKRVMTGDGSDELFAGYNYLLKFDHARLKEELERLWNIMHFSSLKIGRALDMEVSLPYLSNELIALAKSIPVEIKVGEYNGIRYGKYILRECFKHLLGEELAFRRKMAMEEGSGLTRLSLLFEDMISDEEYEEGLASAMEDGVKIRSKEHLYYYNIFKGLYGIPKGNCNVRCPDCLSCIDANARFCKVCGAFPIKPIYTS